MDVMSYIPQNITPLITERLKQAFLEHANKIAATAKSNFTSKGIRTGALRKAIKAKGIVKQNKIWVGVGIDTKAKAVYNGKVVIPFKYSHLVEFGFIDKAGDEVKGIGFLTKAVAAHGGNDALIDIVKECNDETFKEEGAKQKR